MISTPPTLLSFRWRGQPMPGKTIAQLEAALETEIKRLQTDLVGDKELQKAKNQVAASFYMALDSIFYRGMLLGRTATVARWTLLKEFVPKIQQVTWEQIREVAKKYLQADNRTVGVLIPVKSAKAPAGRPHPAQEIR